MNAPRWRRTLPFAAVVGISALATACGGGGSNPAGSRSAGRSGSGLVGYPSFLPKATLHAASDQVLIGTDTRPALTAQGDSVRVEAGSWSVLATVSGPGVPGEGLPYVTPTTTCTWTVNIREASGSVPLSVDQFDTVDQRGDVFHPALVPGSEVPATVRPGQIVSFQIRAEVPTGEGLVRWAPQGGGVVAQWDYIAEND